MWILKLLISAVISFLIGLIVFFITGSIACWLVPPYESGGLHPSMAVGQVLVAFIISVLTGCWLLYFIFTRFRKIYIWLKTAKWT